MLQCHKKDTAASKKYSYYLQIPCLIDRWLNRPSVVLSVTLKWGINKTMLSLNWIKYCKCCFCLNVELAMDWSALAIALAWLFEWLWFVPLSCTDVSLTGIVITLMSYMRAREEWADWATIESWLLRRETVSPDSSQYLSCSAFRKHDQTHRDPS